jgi:hypothetical protein
VKHDHKADFVAALGKNLRENSREEIFGLVYDGEMEGFETVVILFTNGNTKAVNVTGDSCVAIMLDVTKALI